MNKIDANETKFYIGDWVKIIESIPITAELDKIIQYKAFRDNPSHPPNPNWNTIYAEIVQIIPENYLVIIKYKGYVYSIRANFLEKVTDEEMMLHILENTDV